MDAAQLARLPDESRRIDTTRVHVDQSLNSITLEAFDNMCTSQLEYYLLQYANCSALETVVHLCTTYVFVNPTQLAENYNKMTAPISFEEPIETVFKHIEDGVLYENYGTQPYTEAQYIKPLDT
jgi:hypothetical protein